MSNVPKREQNRIDSADEILNPTMYLFRISSVHWSDNIGSKTDEFVVADDIRDVIKYCSFDLQDKGMAIEGITKEVPVTKILCNNSQNTKTTSEQPSS